MTSTDHCTASDVSNTLAALQKLQKSVVAFDQYVSTCQLRHFADKLEDLKQKIKHLGSFLDQTQLNQQSAPNLPSNNPQLGGGMVQVLQSDVRMTQALE